SVVDIRRSGDRRREYSSLLADRADPSPRASRGSASLAIWDCHRVAASWAPKNIARESNDRRNLEQRQWRVCLLLAQSGHRSRIAKFPRLTESRYRPVDQQPMALPDVISSLPIPGVGAPAKSLDLPLCAIR